MKPFLLNPLMFVLSISFSPETDQTSEKDEFVSGIGVTDLDGNEYRTVIIGDQEWMAENLRTTHYANGDSIPNVRESSAWANLESGAWAYYNNQDYFVTHYGKLYNWYAVNDPRDLCPAGWRVPTNDDWKNLEKFLGMPLSELDKTGRRGTAENIAGKLKSDDMELWQSLHDGVSNESGFSGLPGGIRSTTGSFEGIGDLALWWSSSEADDRHAWMRLLSHSNAHIDMLYSDKRSGFSVRCIKGEKVELVDRIEDPDYEREITAPDLVTNPVYEITGMSALSGGNVTHDGGIHVTGRGVVWNITEQPTLDDNIGIASSGSGTGVFTSRITGLMPETRYYVRAYAVNREGIAFGDQVTFRTPPEIVYQTVTDIDGNEYLTVEIGNQVWMAENLRTSRFRNGEDIPYVLSNSEWQDLNLPRSAAWAFYNNNAGNEPFGILYNWYAVNDPRGLCPDGWRVPTDNDWRTLERHLGMSPSESNTTGWRGQNANVGGKLKSVDTNFWRSPNLGATNESGFSALAGGYRFTSGTFSYLTYFGYWWTSSEFDANTAWRRLLFNNRESVNRMNYDKRYGFSVRCIQN